MILFSYQSDEGFCVVYVCNSTACNSCVWIIPELGQW